MARKLADSVTWPSSSSAARSSALARRCTRSKERSPPTSRRPWPGERLIERGAERADGGDGDDAKRDAEHEDGEAAGAGAKLAKGDGERKRQADSRRAGPGEAMIGGGHDAAARRLAPRRS